MKDKHLKSFNNENLKRCGLKIVSRYLWYVMPQHDAAIAMLLGRCLGFSALVVSSKCLQNFIPDLRSVFLGLHDAVCWLMLSRNSLSCSQLVLPHNFIQPYYSKQG